MIKSQKLVLRGSGAEQKDQIRSPNAKYLGRWSSHVFRTNSSWICCVSSGSRKFQSYIARVYSSRVHEYSKWLRSVFNFQLGPIGMGIKLLLPQNACEMAFNSNYAFLKTSAVKGTAFLQFVVSDYPQMSAYKIR